MITIRLLKSNQEAIKADKAYINEFGIESMYPIHYMSHDIYFLSRAYAMEGRYADALKAAEELSQFYTPHFSKMPDLEYYNTAPLFTMLRFHRWKEILDLKAPQDNMNISKILWHFGRAMAYSALGDIEKALDEQKKFLDGASKIPLNKLYGYNKADHIFALADYQLNAKIEEMRGDKTRAIAWLNQAIDIQDQLYYNEPPDWYFPIREALGGILLRDKRYREAEVVLNDDLEKHPRNGRALFGLWLSLKEQGKLADAFWIKREFNETWKYSDTQLTINDL